MLRFPVLFVLVLCSASSARTGSWAEAMFDELFHDFRSVPRGPMLSHEFRLTNNTGGLVHIAGVRVSCGCVSAAALQHDVPDGKSSAILAQMDTRRFAGLKRVTIFVQFDRPGWEEVRLVVQANGRDDFALEPESLAFGRIRRGSERQASVNVAFFGGDWEVLEAKPQSKFVKTEIRRVRRGRSEVAYELTARLRSDTPVGKWYTDVWLKTNRPDLSEIRLPLTVEVEPALSVSPARAVLGDVKSGAEKERKVIVRGDKPFRITAIKGTDDRLSVEDNTKDSKPVHVLTVKLKATGGGDLKRTIRILTDLKEEGEVQFQATAQIVR